MIAPGQKLNTRFTLKVFQDGAAHTMQFADLLTRRTIVSVHMRNNTPTCDRQVDALVAHAAELGREGWNVIALSRDTCGSHGRYAASKAIPFVLASDPDDKFAHAANAVVEKSMYGRTFRGPQRAAFLLERDGTVLGVIEKIDPAQLGEQLRALLKTL
jgi:peroxiredoxin Q/BCP